jgi:hypothetical protein
MVQVIRVYNTKANALAGGTTGIIASATVDSQGGAIHNSSDSIPYFIYNKYFYRIDANEPVSEIHIDWDDGEDNSTEKSNLQIIKLDPPSFFAVTEHIYTTAVGNDSIFFPKIRVKSIDGFLSKFYTNDAALNAASSKTKGFEPFAGSLNIGQNEGSRLSFEKASPTSGSGDNIPHFLPSNLPPVGVLKVDRKRIFAGINNREISNISDAGGTAYPLLYIMTDGSTTSTSVKLTVQGLNDKAIREYTVDDIITSDSQLNTAAEIAKYCAPFNDGSGLEDCADVLLRAELLKGNGLADTERVFIKVFNAVSDLSGNADVSDDATVCILSNGNPIVDLNEPTFSVFTDTSESFTKASNLSIKNVYLDDDNLHNSTIQSQASISSSIGDVSDVMHDDLKVVADDDNYDSDQLSYTHSNKGHLKDSNGRFNDFYRLIRIQVRDDNTIRTGQIDINNRRSFIEHYDDDQYVSTVNSGPLRVPTSEQSRGLILFSNDNDVEEAFWQDLTALSRTDGIMIGGSGTKILRHGADVTQSSTHTRTPHPKNHLLICKSDLFDRVHFRLDNTYAVGETPTEIQITAQYAHKNGWKPLEIQDNTLGLKTSGGIKFKVPADWKKHTASTIESGSWTGPVPADSSEETAEVTRFTATNSDKTRYGGNYVALFQSGGGDEAASTSQNMFVFWFDDGNDSQPSVSGADTFVEVDISSASTKADIATALRNAIISVDDNRFTVGALDTSGSDPFFDVTQLLTGDTQNATTTSDITVSVQTAGSSNLEDPSALWDFSAYAILINFNVKAAATKNVIKNVWPYSNSHSQQIRVVDPHHVSLNDIAIAQSISFNRKGKYVNMEDRFGKTEIRKIGAAGGMVTFGSVDLGDTNAQGNRKIIKSHQQNATPVFLDVTHKSGEITRFFGVITSMSEDHPVGQQFPKYALQMQVSHLLEMDSSGNLLSDKISLGGKINDTRQYVSKT